MEAYIYRTKARFSDTDLYGVVHHSNYFRWLEEARIQLMEDILGYSVSWMEEHALRFPVIHVDGKYRQSVFAGENVEISVYLRYTGAARLEFTYTVRNESGKVCFTAETENAVLRGDRMLLKMPEEIDSRIREKIEEYGKGFIILC
ncbi:MAG TPA: acyl-CoA thioesterase [Ruminococcus sp.]|nr:acyl-CoA thioesterase [Ruminococcus sp.]